MRRTYPINQRVSVSLLRNVCLPCFINTLIRMFPVQWTTSLVMLPSVQLCSLQSGGRCTWDQHRMGISNWFFFSSHDHLHCTQYMVPMWNGFAQHVTCLCIKHKNNSPAPSDQKAENDKYSHGEQRVGVLCIFHPHIHIWREKKNN